MRELSALDIQKINDMKKPLLVESSTRNPALFRYLSTNTLLNDRIIISDPISTTFVQLINNDGSLDIISQYLTAKNLTVDGLSVFNNQTVNGILKSKNLLEANHLSTSGNVTMKSATINNLSVSGSLGGFSGILNINEKTINIGASNTSKINIGTNSKGIVNIGSIGSIVNIFGTMNYIGVEYTNIHNKELIINSISGNKQLLPTNDLGIYLSNGLDDKIGYLKTDSLNGDTFVLKTPTCPYVLNTPKLNSDSTLLIEDKNGLVMINDLEVSKTKSNRIYVKDVLEVLENVRMERDGVSIQSDISSSGSLFLNQNLLVLGNVSLGKHIIDNNIYFDGDLVVTGNSSFNSNVQIQGNLSISQNIHVSNDIKIGNNLDIDGNLFLNNDLHVENNAFFNHSKVVITGALKVNDSFIVKKNTVLANTFSCNSIDVSNNAYIKHLDVHSINVNDSCDLDNIHVLNKAQIDKSLDVSGNCSIHGETKVNNINISGNAFFNGSNVIIDGGLKVSKRGIIVNGMSLFNNKVNILKGLNIKSEGIVVVGNSTFCNSNVSIDGNLKINGDITESNSISTNKLYVDDTMNVNGKLNIQGDISSNNMNLLGALKTTRVDTKELITNKIDVHGGMNVDSDIRTNTLEVLDKSTLNSVLINESLQVNKNVNIYGDIYCHNSTFSISGDMDCKGKIDLDGEMKVLGDIIGKNLIINNDIDVGRNLNLGNDINVDGYLNVLKDANFNNVSIRGDEIIVGDVEIGGCISISSNTKIQGNLEVANKLLINEKSYSHLENVLYDGLSVHKSSTFRSDLTVYGNLKVSKNLVLGNNALLNKNLNILNDLEVSNNAKIGNNLFVSGNVKIGKKVNVESLDVENGILIGDTIKIGKSEITINNIPLATHDYIKTISTTYCNLTLDNTIDKVGNIDEGVYTYLVTKDKIDKFEQLGDGVNGQINCMVEDLDNNIYVGGSFKTIGKSNIESPYFAKWIRRTGQWQAISNDCLGVVQNLLVNSKNEVYVAGPFNNSYNSNLMKYDPVTNSFSPIEGFNGFIKCLALDSDDNIYVGGLFERINGMRVNHFVKIIPDVNQIIGLGKGLPGIVTGLVIDRMDNIYIVSGLKNIYKYDSEDKKIKPTNITFNDSIFSICLDSKDNLYVGGRFSKVQINEEILECKSVIRYRSYIDRWETLGEGLNPDVKSLAIDLNDDVYASTTTIEPLFKWNHIENRWEYMNLGVNGQIFYMLFDSYNHLYLGGILSSHKGNICRFYSNNRKVIQFYNTIKLIDNEKALNCRKIIMNSLSDTISIKFTNSIGYIIYKAGNIKLIR